MTHTDQRARDGSTSRDAMTAGPFEGGGSFDQTTRTFEQFSRILVGQQLERFVHGTPPKPPSFRGFAEVSEAHHEILDPNAVTGRLEAEHTGPPDNVAYDTGFLLRFPQGGRGR